MNIARIIFVALTLVVTFPLLAAEKDMDVSCADPFYACLSGEDLKTLVGKTLRYKNGRFNQFGVVVVVLRADGQLTISNAKSSAVGTWFQEGDRINLNVVTWSEKYSFRFIKITDRLFVITTSGTGGVALSPLEVTE